MHPFPFIPELKHTKIQKGNILDFEVLSRDRARAQLNPEPKFEVKHQLFLVVSDVSSSQFYWIEVHESGRARAQGGIRRKKKNPSFV